MRRAALILLTLAAGAAATWGAFESGNTLNTACAAEWGTPDYSYCQGYAAGVYDTLTTLQELGTLQLGICAPSTVTVGQVKDVVGKYLKEHPEKRQLTGNFLVYSALREAFPCEAEE